MEGPSLILLKEQLQRFIGMELITSTGSTRQLELSVLTNKVLFDVQTWGKHLLLQFGDATVRIHFLMFGSFRIAERKAAADPRLSLVFPGAELNFYSCSLALLTVPLDELYDWRVDVMSDKWDPDHVLRLLKQLPEDYVCDALLRQELFAGVGNIIKNEVLFLLGLSPFSLVGQLDTRTQEALIHATRDYCFQFLAWKRVHQLKAHWKVYRKHECPQCRGRLEREKTGQMERMSFYCKHCQPAEAARKVVRSGRQ